MQEGSDGSRPRGSLSNLSAHPDNPEGQASAPFEATSTQNEAGTEHQEQPYEGVQSLTRGKRHAHASFHRCLNGAVWYSCRSV